MKKYVIMEVALDSPPSTGFKPAMCSETDLTWIDARHVIDGDRLKYCIPKAGETYFAVSQGWAVASWNMSVPCLILDPPKEPEGDEWEKWEADRPRPHEERFWNIEKKFNADNFDRSQKAWLAKMPRRK